MKKELSIGYSPCPNDTFIFYALVKGKITGSDIVVREVLEDVETLNRMATEGVLDITKLSYHAYGHVRDEYCLLRAGGALGRGCGPLIVANGKREIESLRGKRIAVPGRFTTAFLLLQLFDPVLGENVVFMPFDEIMEAVSKGSCDAGVIIHEGRFTFGLYGLDEVLDLGEWWEQHTGLMLPLGAIAARRSLGPELINAVEGSIRSSIRYAFDHSEEAMPYIKEHSQEMEDEVIKKHIGLYVNDLSLDIGEEGERAIMKILGMAEERNIFEKKDVSIFI